MNLCQKMTMPLQHTTYIAVFISFRKWKDALLQADTKAHTKKSIFMKTRQRLKTSTSYYYRRIKKKMLKFIVSVILIHLTLLHFLTKTALNGQTDNSLLHIYVFVTVKQIQKRKDKNKDVSKYIKLISLCNLKQRFLRTFDKIPLW